MSPRLAAGARRPAGDSLTDALAATLQRSLGDAYELQRELGGGGMSRVFAARDRTLNRDVVVKVLSPDATAGVSGERFRREIQTIARLQHPHIVSILTAGGADGALYYVMPFVAGETLRARITREGALPVSDVVRMWKPSGAPIGPATLMLGSPSRIRSRKLSHVRIRVSSAGMRCACASRHPSYQIVAS